MSEACKCVLCQMWGMSFREALLSGYRDLYRQRSTTTGRDLHAVAVCIDGDVFAGLKMISGSNLGIWDELVTSGLEDGVDHAGLKQPRFEIGTSIVPRAGQLT